MIFSSVRPQCRSVPADMRHTLTASSRLCPAHSHHRTHTYTSNHSLSHWIYAIRIALHISSGMASLSYTYEMLYGTFYFALLYFLLVLFLGNEATDDATFTVCYHTILLSNV